MRRTMMQKTCWQATAPSNIALIKYMGKQEGLDNLPDNPSFSYTLPQLETTVRLTFTEAKTSGWEPFEASGAIPFGEVAQHRFLDHLTHVKQFFAYAGHFQVASRNNFPHSVGLASSASSFAALTRCAATALSQLTQKALPSTAVLAQLARKGSGSACRSFYAPWCLWTGEDAKAMDLPITTLCHQVIVLDGNAKAVSSSQAHQRVKTSPAYAGRTLRAEKRLDSLLNALVKQDWKRAFQVVWEEFMDMHHLFETATPAFSYLTPRVKAILGQIAADWQSKGDGPIVTMDAGSSIHLLYRPDQVHLQAKAQEYATRF